MKEETRGIIEKAIDRMRFGFTDIEVYQEITPIQNMEEFLLGYALGYLRKVCELIVFMQGEKMTTTNEKVIRKIILTRIPELRKKLVQYLNK